MANTIRDYSATAASNTVVDGADISEGCSPAGINDAIRGVMADLKDVSTGAVALESPAFDSVTGNLNVNGNVTADGLTVDGNVSINGTNAGQLTLDATGQYTQMLFEQNSVANSGGDLIYDHTGNQFQLRSLSAGSISFKTGTSVGNTLDRVVITSGGNVGIGGSNPLYRLAVEDSSGATRVNVRNNANAAAGSGIFFEVLNGGSTVGNGTIATQGNGDMAFFTGTSSGTERLRIDSSGRVTMPYQPAFSAYFAGNNNNTSTLGSGGGYIVLNATYYNQGSHFSTSTGRFTAPVAGAYQFNTCFFSFNNGSLNSQTNAVQIRINGTLKHYLNYAYSNASSTYYPMSGSCILYLNASDYVQIYTTTGVYTDANNAYTHWSGYLVG